MHYQSKCVAEFCNATDQVSLSDRYDRQIYMRNPTKHRKLSGCSPENQGAMKKTRYPVAKGERVHQRERITKKAYPELKEFQQMNHGIHKNQKGQKKT